MNPCISYYLCRRFTVSMFTKSARSTRSKAIKVNNIIARFIIATVTQNIFLLSTGQLIYRPLDFPFCFWTIFFNNSTCHKSVPIINKSLYRQPQDKPQAKGFKLCRASIGYRIGRLKWAYRQALYFGCLPCRSPYSLSVVRLALYRVVARFCINRHVSKSGSIINSL